MKQPVFKLCDQIRESAYALHQHLRHGYVEKVYENGLANRLRRIGLKVAQQHPISVFDDDETLLGEFHADLLVENFVIVELKACRCLANEHVAQLLGYLRGCRIEHGLLINFGAPKLEIRKYALSSLPN